jgi:hypothetical protein
MPAVSITFESTTRVTLDATVVMFTRDASTTIVLPPLGFLRLTSVTRRLPTITFWRVATLNLFAHQIITLDSSV